MSSQAREEVELLEKLRAEDELFWRQFNSLRFDSWSEKRLLVRLVLLGSQLAGVRLERLPLYRTARPQTIDYHSTGPDGLEILRVVLA